MKLAPVKSRIGFGAPASLRLTLTLVYALAAGGAVLWVQGRAANAEDKPPATITEHAARVATLELSASFDVSEWSVTLGGTRIEPASQSATSWSGELRLDSGAPADLLVEALRDDPLSDRPDALRLVLRDGDRVAERTYWGSGGVTALFDPAKEFAP